MSMVPHCIRTIPHKYIHHIVNIPPGPCLSTFLYVSPQLLLLVIFLLPLCHIIICDFKRLYKIWEWQMRESMYLPLQEKLNLLNMIILSCIQFLINHTIVSVMDWWKYLSIVNIYHILLICSSIVRKLHWFCNLAVINHAVINIDEQESFTMMCQLRMKTIWFKPKSVMLGHKVYKFCGFFGGEGGIWFP